MPNSRPPLTLTVLIVIVSGKESMRHSLTALYPQINFDSHEIIVPFDEYSLDVESLSAEFPEVQFHFIDDLGKAGCPNISEHQHRLYDRRRAVGLGIARGQIVAMTEDHAIPSKDWCQQLLLLHKQPFEVIGGAIENSVDHPLNWAWYYCDFGRYGRPLLSGEVKYVSDINVAYKQNALKTVRDVWQETYSEPIVHGAMRSRGINLFFDERMLVYQERPHLKLSKALRERFEWGRVFAETRVKMHSGWRRLGYAAGAILLPPLLLWRVTRNMLRQKRTIRQIVLTLPLAALLILVWTIGELIGYVVSSKNN